MSGRETGLGVVHVVDDDAAVRDSLLFLLDSAGLAARTYESGPELIEAAADLAPGCVVTDIRMPEMNGLDLVRKLAEMGLPHPVIVLTGHGDVPLAVEAMKAGVVDFLEKPFDDEALLKAVRAALARREGQAAQAAEQAELRERIASLTLREREVFDAVVAGHPNKIVAHQLGISPRTVEIYRAHVMTKMKAASLSELVRMAMLAGPA